MRPRWPPSGRISTYRPVQFCQATSLGRLSTTMKEKIMIDLRNVYRPEDLQDIGFAYIGVGR